MNKSTNALICTVAVTLGLTGCASFSVKAPVIGVLADDLFLGEAVGYMDRTGTIDIKSALNPDTRCVGSFRYTGAKTGVASVRCNDGEEAVLNFNALSTLSGYGIGKTSKGPASFTFGLTPEEAAQYLTLPKGKKLSKQPAGPRLSDV